jgi:uroporphyrinogen decarboxylase
MSQYTPMDRMIAAFKLERPDRVPVLLDNALATCRAIGRKIGDLVRNPEVFCDALCTSYEKYGYDAIRISSDVAVEAEAMGGTAVYPEDAPVALKVHPLKGESDFSKLVPPNPYTDGRMPIMLKTVEFVRKRLGENAFISASVSGPGNMTSQLLGVEKYLLMSIEAPEFVEKILDFTAEITVLYAKALFKAGATCIVMGEAVCSCSVIGKDRYIELVQKRHKRIVEEYDRSGMHYHTLHICGNIAPILKDVADTGIASLDIDAPMNLVASRETLGRRVTMIGNIAPAELLMSPPERITELCEKALSCKEGLGFVLGVGCNLNPNTTEENIHAMVDAAKTYGLYD